MPTTKSDTGELLEQIYQRLEVPTALAELEPKKTGQAYTLTCPQCGKRRAFIYEGSHTIKCNRMNECGYAKNLWDYVAERDSLTEGRDIIRALAEMAGFTLPELAPEAMEAIKQAEVKQTKLEAAQAIFTSRLFSKEGIVEMQYLHSRGYTDNDIAAMGLGCVPPKSALTDMLKDRIADQDTTVPELTVTGFGDTHTLSIPFRNRRGQLIGWSVRTISNAEPKYKYSVGMSTGDELFNLDQCRGLTNLTVVEGPIDALIATARGIPGVVACGRAKPTDKQLDGLQGLNIASLTLALDNDEAGQTGTVETIYKLAPRGIATYVVTYPPHVKDLDEYINEFGAGEALNLLDIDTATPGHAYLIEKLDRENRKGDIMSDAEQRAVMRELIELHTQLNDNLATRDITKYLTQKLEIPAELIHQAMQEHSESKLLAERQQGYSQLQAKAGQLAKAGKIDELEQLYTETLPSLKAKNVRTILEPYSSDLFVADLQLRREGYTTGFHELDEYALIPPEALTIVAGRPSHGKTTVMLNMLYNLVVTYPSQSFYFFSYEETRSQLALKLITLMAGVQIDQYKNTQKVEEYFKTGHLDSEYLKGITLAAAKVALDKAKDEYNHLVTSGRLWLIDEPMLVTDLCGTIEQLASERGNIGAVFIDYMQKIKSKFNAPTRQVEIQKISGELLDTAKRAGVAVVLGAQLNRSAERSDGGKSLSLDQLRESGDIEQDAHLVLGLYNHARGEYDAAPDEAGLPKANTTIDVKILKNRSGVTNKTTALTYDSPILTLKSSKTIDNKRGQL